jgi:SAM-dependent methyltransferase
MADVLSHNERAAATWGSGGRDYDRISEFVADALAHLVNRLVPQSGERFLDVGTGTGSTARLLSARGAIVTGIDIGAGVIEAAMFHTVCATAPATSQQSGRPISSSILQFARGSHAAEARLPVVRSGLRATEASHLHQGSLHGPLENASSGMRQSSFGILVNFRLTGINYIDDLLGESSQSGQETHFQFQA